MAFVITAVVATDVTLASVALAVGELGLSLSVVGAVTGSKDLTKWGGVLGLAGGVGSLAAGAFDAAADAGLAEGAMTGADEAGNYVLDQAGSLAEKIASEPLEYAGVGDSAGQGGSSIFDSATDAASDAASAANNATADTTFNGMPSQSGATGSQQGIISGNSGAPSSTSSVAGAPQAQGASPSPTFGSRTLDASGNPMFSDAHFDSLGTTQSLEPPPSGGSWSDWWNKQPDLVKSAIIQTGGHAVGGLFQGWTEEQKLALQQQVLNLQQQQYTSAMKNASSQPTFNFKPPTGIINTARSGG